MLQIIVNSVLQAAIAYLLLLTVVRFMGRKAISEMTFFDFAVAITLGAITANLAIGQKFTRLSVAIVLITFGVLAILTSYLHIKSMWIRKLTNSEPVTAIENGRINNKNLSKIRLNINELNSLLREKNIFNLADVEFAIMESTGKLSVLPKSQKSPLTPSDLKIPTSYKGLTRDLIMDGKVLAENLQSINLDEKWLEEELKKNGITGIDQVFYAGLDSSGKMYTSVKQINRKEKPGQHGID